MSQPADSGIPGVKCTPEKIEKEYEKSLDRLLMGETTAFAIPTGVGPKHSRLTFFNAHIFKECVFEIELYEDRDE